MSENLRHIQNRARELACSGKFAGWTQSRSNCVLSSAIKKRSSGSTARQREKNSIGFVTLLENQYETILRLLKITKSS